MSESDALRVMRAMTREHILPIFKELIRPSMSTSPWRDDKPWDGKPIWVQFSRMAMPWDDPKDIHKRECARIVSEGRRECDCK